MDTLSKYEVIQGQLDDARARLTLYLDQERKILTGGVQAYGLGTRNLTRYQTDLTNIRAAIKDLKAEIQELEGRQEGARPRRAVRIIPRDW